MSLEKQILLRSGRDRSVQLRHPWIFASAIESIKGSPEAGDTLQVISHEGEELGTASYSPGSQIRARMWSFDPQEPIDGEFFSRRLKQPLI